MDLNWFQSIVYGLLSGLSDILPVSARAHQTLALKFFGVKDDVPLMNLLIHIAIIGALYISCQSQFVRISRARALARVPKRRRKRPLDTRSLMDFSLIKTMMIPALLGLVLYHYTSGLNGNLMLVALFLFINGVILYIPQFLPTSNRDSRTLSRVEGLLMGLGGLASVLPGVSAVGTSTSIGSVCGVERSYSLNMALMMQIFLTAGMLVYDVVSLAAVGLAGLSLAMLARYLLGALFAFGAAFLSIKLMRYLAEHHSFSLFAFYCFGLALFTFLLNLMA